MSWIAQADPGNYQILRWPRLLTSNLQAPCFIDTMLIGKVGQNLYGTYSRSIAVLRLLASQYDA